MPFDTDFIRFKITDKKVPKRTAIQETVLDAVRSYNAVSYTHLLQGLYLVPLMFLAFAGCMYLIFAPADKEDVNVESVGGFNADIPLPAEDGIIADKQKAYEQAVISRKQQDKIQDVYKRQS